MPDASIKSSLSQQLARSYQGIDEFRSRVLELDVNVTVVSLDGIADDSKISATVIEPLVRLGHNITIDDIIGLLSYNMTVEKVLTYDKMVANFVNGHTIVFVQGYDDQCLSIDTRIAIGRAITEPPTSLVMRGPREGFVEDIKTNLTLMRKRLKCAEFRTVNLSVGKYTNTSIAVCYIEGVASQDLVSNIVQKVKSIVIDGVLDSYYISDYLDGNKTLLFRRVGTSEKPDIVCGKMLEGRVAIIVDGSPMVLTLPYLFIEDLQSPSDYHDGSTVASVGRVLRFISVIASVLLPAIYVSLQKYNYQIIPLKFLITILNATEAIPFSPLSEMLMVIIVFDILREANLRMPTAVGMSLSLVGAIVLGDAAVKAGLLGAPAVMIGALSGIGLFAMPENTLILSLLRIVVTFIGGVMGLFGVIVCMLMIVGYMVGLQEFGAPFLAPYAPIVGHDKQDAVLRRGLKTLTKRPKSFDNKNEDRRGE